MNPCNCGLGSLNSLTRVLPQFGQEIGSQKKYSTTRFFVGGAPGPERLPQGIASQRAYFRDEPGEDIALVSTTPGFTLSGFEGGFGAADPVKWEHNSSWARTYRKRAVDWSKAIDTNASLVLYGLRDAAPSLGGTGLTLGDEFPNIKRIANDFRIFSSNFKRRLSEADRIFTEASLYLDGAAMWKLKDWYKSYAIALEEASKLFAGMIQDRLNQRSAKSKDLRDDRMTSSQRSTLSHLKDAEAWRTMSRAVGIAVNKAAGVAGKAAGAAVGVGVDLATHIVEGAAEGASKPILASMWRNPLFWGALGLGGFLIWKSGIVQQLVKGLISMRTGVPIR